MLGVVSIIHNNTKDAILQIVASRSGSYNGEVVIVQDSEGIVYRVDAAMRGQEMEVVVERIERVIEVAKADGKMICRELVKMHEMYKD